MIDAPTGARAGGAGGACWGAGSAATGMRILLAKDDWTFSVYIGQHPAGAGRM